MNNSKLHLNTEGSCKLLQNFETSKKGFQPEMMLQSQPKFDQSSFKLSSSKGNNNLRNNNLSYNLDRSNDYVDVDSNDYFRDQLSSLQKRT